MSDPFHLTCPCVGWEMVARMRIRVDLPAPLGPSSPTTPGSSSSEKSRSPQTPPGYCLPTRSIESFMMARAPGVAEGARRTRAASRRIIARPPGGPRPRIQWFSGGLRAGYTERLIVERDSGSAAFRRAGSPNLPGSAGELRRIHSDPRRERSPMAKDSTEGDQQAGASRNKESISPAGERFPLPEPADYAAEFERLSRLAAE